MSRYLVAAFLTALGVLLWHADRLMPWRWLARQLYYLDYWLSSAALWCLHRSEQQ